MTKLRVVTLLGVELALAVVCGLTLFIATDRFQSCETAYSGCGTSAIVTVANNGIDLMAFVIVASVIVIGVPGVMRIGNKK